MRTLRLLGILLGVMWICPGHAGPIPAVQPEGWDANLKIPEAQDLNSDPKIVEINLEARVANVDIGGHTLEAWTYNGGVPGPLIRAKIGDRLIVHFTNRLPEATTVHWHGVRVPIQMDGVPELTQPEVKPGETFTYDFTVPDAGLFWYHPHIGSAKQVGFGLSGPLLVDDPAEDVGVPDQQVLVLNDIDEQGSKGPVEWGGSTGMAFGREGNIMLVNGRKNPKILARSGAPQRWRIVNTAKSRYFMLDLGTGGKFTKIGSDAGLQEYPTEMDALVVAPGERADVIVSPSGKPGSELAVVAEPFDRGYGTFEYRNAEDLLHIAFSDLPPLPSRPLPMIRRSIKPLSAAGATPVTIDLAIKQEPGNGKFEYHINGKPYWETELLHAKIGETQLWTVNNATPWSHPIHLHGFFFQVLDGKDQPVRPIEWKDTVNVPYKSTLKLLVRFDERPGMWMIHCHILDHAEGGLMTAIQVGDGPAKPHVHLIP